MKRETIEAKLSELRASREQLMTQLHAHAGAIGVLEELLKAETEPA